MATGLIVGESLFGVAFAGIVGGDRQRYAAGPGRGIRLGGAAGPGRFRRSIAWLYMGRTPSGERARVASAAVGATPWSGSHSPAGGAPDLPEDVDRDAAARIPVAADAQPRGLHLLDQPLADADGHVLVEAAVVAERAEEQLEALRFDDRLARRIVDHQVREIGLAGDRAQRSELGRGEADQVERAGRGLGT